jgi:oxygen-dependent protoporphyrinogen oxidase
MTPLVAPFPAPALRPTSAFVQVVVLGAGVSGLTCTHALRQRGIDAQLFESSAEPGGVMRSRHRENFLFELGPQSFTLTDSLSELARELDLSAELRLAPAELPRYLFLDNQLAPAPLSPAAFFKSSLFTARTKMSVIRDLLGNSKPPAATALGEESIAHFIRRKFSAELLDKLVGPLVSGIYAGDPQELAVRSAFPQLYEAESRHGSIIRGMVRSRKTGSARQPLAAFRSGNQTLSDTLANSLGKALHLGVTAAGISTNAAGRGRYLVQFRDAGEGARSVSFSARTDRIVLATPSGVSSELLAALDPEIASLLAAIPYAPIAVVSLGYRQSAIKNDLHGFGFLVPRNSGLRLLGCVWNSSIFDERAPDGTVLLTGFVGGVSDPSAVQLAPRALEALVHQDLQRILAVSENPIIANVQIWHRAIPQYDLAHHRRSQLLAQAFSRHPGIGLAGNFLDGPAIGAVVDRARKLADYILDSPPQ